MQLTSKERERERGREKSHRPPDRFCALNLARRLNSWVIISRSRVTLTIIIGKKSADVGEF